MPRVPTYTQQVREAPLTGGESQVRATPEAFGAAGAAQLMQLGKSLGDLGNALDRANEAQAETAAKEADVQFTQRLSELQYHPERGYMSRQGRNAVDTYKDAANEADKLQSNALDSLSGNPLARRLAANVLAQRKIAAVQAMSQHAATENVKWQAQTSDARAKTTLIAAADTPDDPKIFAQALHTAFGEADHLGQLHGWDSATTSAKKIEFADLAYKNRYESWAARDPVAAFGNFATNQRNISPLVRDQLRTKLFHDAAPVLADELNAIGGVGIVQPQAAGTTGTLPESLPRGERNNNPGNILRGETQWRGEVVGNDPRYASFETPEAGIRAMAKTLDTYSTKYGLDTVQGIIARWAPSTENPTGAYIKTVATALGVKPDQPLDLKDPATMSGLVKAIIKQENGRQSYSDEQITHGISMVAAYPDAPAPGEQAAPDNPGAASRPVNQATRAPLRDINTPTGIALVDALPANEKLYVLQLARTQGAKAMADARELLRGRVQDTQAEYMARGVASNPPVEGEFIRAYGQAEGLHRFRAMQEVANLGRQIQQVNTLPASHLDQLLAQAKPAPGDGFADRQHNYEILTRAIDQVQEQRQKDPVGFALTTGSYGIKPLGSMANPEALGQALASRAAAAPRIAQDYGTRLALFSTQEAKAVSATLKAAPVDGQKQYLGAMFKGIGDLGLFKSTMQALAPDNPVLAVAGMYQARGLTMTDGRDVADLMLRGQAILSPNTKEDGKGHEGGRSLVKMPEEKLMLSDFNAASGEAFRGKEQAMDLFYQTSKAIYAARSAEVGDYSGVIDSNRWKAAIQLATGGIDGHNGAKIVLPYGMARDVFQNTLKQRVEALAAARPPVGANAADLLRLPLENVGDGRYLFRRGAGYVVDKNGQPLIVDVNAGPKPSRFAAGPVR